MGLKYIFMFALTGSRKVLFVSELTLHLLDDDVFSKKRSLKRGQGGNILIKHGGFIFGQTKLILKI